jgi:hypothetical protein
MTRHGQLRSQQRCIPHIVIDLLLQFGASERAGDGATKRFFDKRSRRKLHAYAGPLAPLLDQHLNVYAVVSSDDRVITVAHRVERITKH